jgi:TRAP-type C4-dicarboxylate transport system permease small subunit
MTGSLGGRSVFIMKNGRFTSPGLVILALTAVVSLAAGHLTDLGEQLLGSGPVSTFALVGDVLGLIACGISAWFGWRYIARSRTAEAPPATR